MYAAIDKSLDRTLLVPVEDDRSLTEIGRPKITRVRDLGIEPEKTPNRSAKDPPDEVS